MELSILRLQDPLPAPVSERRRRIRHKLHTPAYVSFKGPKSGLAIDLSELLDISEDGFAVHTSEYLDINGPVSFSIDLPETGLHIHSTGQVVWSDADRRTGIQFSGLPDETQRQLKQWLFVNLLIARTNYGARTGEVSSRAETLAPPQPVVHSALSASVADLTGMLSAVEAVRREIRAAGDDFDAVLHLITERALSLTGATGAALALLTDTTMVCRSSAGEPAMPLGMPVDSKQGLSGECVRSGRMVTCEDTATDTRVDPEVCRSLGIGSMLAAPILSDFRVAGLIEVFSPQARAFTKVHETALDRLVELVPKAQSPIAPTRSASAEVPSSFTGEAVARVNPIQETAWEPAQEPLKGLPVRLGHLASLFLALAGIALGAGYLLAPRIEKMWRGDPAVANRQPISTTGTASTASSSIPSVTRIETLRKRAEAGDAEAQWDMGARYHNGQDVPQSDVQAAQWFQRAADQGHVNAQSILGAYYWAGRGVPRNLTQAYFWSAVALHQGDRDSESRLRGLALQMTREQVVTAQQQVDDWLRQHHASK